MLERLRTAWTIFKLSFHLSPVEVQFVVNGLRQLQELGSGYAEGLAETLTTENAGLKTFNRNDTVKVAEYRARPEDA